ncbi:hypothetical protein ACFL35_05410 [Candidatus Riflebacteria bacterium]
MQIRFPASPVGIGDSWQSKVVPNPALPIPLNINYKIVGFQNVVGKSCVIIQSTVTTGKNKEEGIDLKVRAKGKIYFDYQHGIMVKNEVQTKMHLDMISQIAGKMTRIITNMEMRLRMYLITPQGENIFVVDNQWPSTRTQAQSRNTENPEALNRKILVYQDVMTNYYSKIAEVWLEKYNKRNWYKLKSLSVTERVAQMNRDGYPNVDDLVMKVVTKKFGISEQRYNEACNWEYAHKFTPKYKNLRGEKPGFTYINYRGNRFVWANCVLRWMIDNGYANAEKGPANLVEKDDHWLNIVKFKSNSSYSFIQYYFKIQNGKIINARRNQ